MRIGFITFRDLGTSTFIGSSTFNDFSGSWCCGLCADPFVGHLPYEALLLQAAYCGAQGHLFISYTYTLGALPVTAFINTFIGFSRLSHNYTFSVLIGIVSNGNITSTFIGTYTFIHSCGPCTGSSCTGSLNRLIGISTFSGFTGTVGNAEKQNS